MRARTRATVDLFSSAVRKGLPGEGGYMGAFDFQKSKTVRVVLSLVLFLPLSRPNASEDTEPARVKLGPRANDLKAGPGMRAAGRHLKGSEFVGQDLHGAVFDGCDLEGVVFFQCNLSGASFKGARLTGMNITDCKIEGADFADAVINGVAGMPGGYADPPFAGWPHDMRLTEKQLLSTRSFKEKDLSRCVLSRYGQQESTPAKWDFRGMNLERAHFSRGDFRECDLAAARIDGIQLVVCTIAFEQFSATDNFANRRSLHGAVFRSVQLAGEWSFRDMDLSGTVFEDVRGGSLDFGNADVAGCTFGRGIEKGRLRSTRNFTNGELMRMKFYEIDLSALNLSAFNLSEASFSGCDFTDTTFDDAVITRARFLERNRGITARQIESTWNYKHGRMEGVVLAKDLAAALEKKGKK